MALTSVMNGKVESLLQKDDNLITMTTIEQRKVERLVLGNYEKWCETSDLIPKLKLFKSRHLSYLKKGLGELSTSYQCLDSSRPWFCFWILHSFELLQEPIPQEICNSVSTFLDKCQNHETGGFAGGPNQISHLAPTYAAVCALCILGRYCEKAYNVINRQKLAEFLNSRHKDDGSFTMHADGEVDIRGAYCAIVCARLTNVYTKEMFLKTANWLKMCQTFEGGFAGLPGLEAHGGYTFCGFAAVVLLGQEQKIDIKRLLKWTVLRQMRFEGGFQGRTNKLVDSCYSFWQGAVFPIIHSILQLYGDENLSQENWMFDQIALEEYILGNCQILSGGLCDKPGKSRDYYHTCYSLSGLSVAQHFIGDGVKNTKLCGGNQNLLDPIHPIFNVCIQSAEDALGYFKNLTVPS